METNTNKRGIEEKLLKVQQEMLKFHKGKTNPFFKSKYLDLDSLLETLLPVVNKHGLLIHHRVFDKELGTLVTDVETGTNILSEFPLPENPDPQKVGSAITYAKRYNLASIFNIVSDEDDDGNGAKPTPKKAEQGNDLPF